jgi:hypothetical protein
MSIAKKSMIALAAALITATLSTPSFSEDRGAVDRPAPDHIGCTLIGGVLFCWNRPF